MKVKGTLLSKGTQSNLNKRNTGNYTETYERLTEGHGKGSTIG